MAFTFTNYAALPDQASPFKDILSKALSGYTEATKARFLKPGLEEALKKAKLYNQYYGPNIESQMGLRGAQASHLGALTAGQNITNDFLPEKLKAETAESKFKAQNPLLSSTGVGGYLGALLYLKQHPELSQGGSQWKPQIGDTQSYVPPVDASLAQQPQQQTLQNNLYNSIMNNLSNAKNLSAYDKAKRSLSNAIATYGQDSPEAEEARNYVSKVSGSTESLTNTVRTQIQKMTIGLPKLEEAIKRIKDLPSPFSLSLDFSGKAAHHAAVLSAAETMAATKGWPNTGESIARAEQILERGYLESDTAYRTRLDNELALVKNDLARLKGKKATTTVSKNNDPLGIR